MYMFILGSCNVCAVCQSRDTPCMECQYRDCQVDVPAASQEVQGAAMNPLFVLQASDFVSIIIWLLKFLFMSSKRVFVSKKIAPVCGSLG